MLDLLKDHPRQIGATRNPFAVLIEVHCRSSFAPGRFLNIGGFLELLDRRVQRIADKVAADLSRRIGLPGPENFHDALSSVRRKKMMLPFPDCNPADHIASSCLDHGARRPFARLRAAPRFPSAVVMKVARIECAK